MKLKYVVGEEPIRRVRSVEFNSRVKVKQVTSVTSMEGVERDELWLQSDELHQMKEARKRDVQLYRKWLLEDGGSSGKSSGGGSGNNKKKHPPPNDGSPNSPIKALGSGLTSRMKRIGSGGGLGGLLGRGRSPIRDGSANSATTGLTKAAAPSNPTDPTTTMVDSTSKETDGGEEFRGLERWGLDKEIVKTRKNDAMGAVLIEQAQQVYSGKEYNDEQIAERYVQSTDGAMIKAHQLGQQDHDDIQNYLMSPRTQKLMSLSPKYVDHPDDDDNDDADDADDDNHAVVKDNTPTRKTSRKKVLPAPPPLEWW